MKVFGFLASFFYSLMLYAAHCATPLEGAHELDDEYLEFVRQAEKERFDDQLLRALGALTDISVLSANSLESRS